MKLESSAYVEAPPEVAFRFFSLLDHLRFVCTPRRLEWCHETGRRQTADSQHEVRLRQAYHEIRLRFRVVSFVQDEVIDVEFLSWPLRGARRSMRFTAEGSGTRVVEINEWSPPRIVRSAVQNRAEDQQSLFDQKLDNSKRIIEAVYAARGAESFVDGVFADAEPLGIKPVVD